MVTVEFVWLLLVCLSFTKFLVHAQDQKDFISIDCGATGAYSDQTTKLTYVPDDKYIDSGVSKDIKSDYKTGSPTRFWNVRSFPEGKRNCYDLTGLNLQDTKYLVRAQFMYGNYDSKSQAPKFDVYLGVDYWDTVNFPTANASSTIHLEMIYTPSSNFTYVCLVNTGEGTPFISVLELRSLNLENPAYSPPGNGTALKLSQRYDMGSAEAQYRYPDDIHDRIWTRYEYDHSAQDWKDISTDKKIVDGNYFQPPEIIMNTAVTPQSSSGNIIILWRTNSYTDKYYFSFYFCEFATLLPGQLREIQIYVNDTAHGDSFNPQLATVLTQQFAPVASSGDWLNISILSTRNATLAPFLNAFEVYNIKELTQVETVSGDVEAMKNIKTAYGLTKNWQGDPCLPQQYSWEGLNCFNNSQGSPTVTSLNLSSSGLSGEISPSISGLTSLENLDLSNNNLKGPIPGFLSQMTSLKVLNLKGNKLTGTIPSGLLNRSNQQTLSLSVEGNPDICYPYACKAKKKNNIVIPLAAASLSGLIIVLAIILWRIRSQKRGKETNRIKQGHSTPLKSSKRQFKYSEVVKMTNNFIEKVGEGGFGIVYRGRLNGTEVAVKKLSPPSAKGYKDFQSEAKILMTINHKNLISIVGFCEEGGNLCLVNEFMINGNLETYLLGQNPKSLTWESRLSIALDTAHGLEYLHNQCIPPIIHREIKLTNILLDEEFQAKLADFGLSRDIPTEIGNPATVPGAGTPGYRSPSYEPSGELSKKIDVYAFGVVLLDLISGRPVRGKNAHVTHWAETKGCVEEILDERLGEEYDKDSVRKAFEVAMTCILPTPSQRPDMNDVMTDLKKCLNMEKARLGGPGNQSTYEDEEPFFNEDTRERRRAI